MSRHFKYSIRRKLETTRKTFQNEHKEEKKKEEKMESKS